MKSKQYASKNLMDRIYLFFSQMFVDKKNPIRQKSSPAHASWHSPLYRPESKYLSEAANDHKSKYPGTYPFLYRYRWLPSP